MQYYGVRSAAAVTEVRAALAVNGFARKRNYERIIAKIESIVASDTVFQPILTVNR